MLNDLKKDSGRSELLNYAEDQIKTYAKQGREADLTRIEGYITDRFQNAPESIRALINTFIVIGLMGTLFSLFAMGHQPGNFTEPSAILSRMGIAFSASFFGIVWALVCSVVLLNPLRRRTNYAIQEIHRRLTELSAENPPEVPEKGLELVAEILRENVNAIGAVVDRLEQREEENRISSREILTHFSETTTTVINQLVTKVEEAQTRTDQVTLSLTQSITSSLTELKERFVEISESWRTEMQQTIAASENAATRLSESSNNLAESTKDVSATLKSVSGALERTKDLAKIVAAIEKVTTAYLDQTGDQINVFKTGLNVTMDAARAIPDEWYTMLTLVKDDLAKRFEETAHGWKTHVDVTGDILVSRTEAVGNSVTSLSQFFAPTAPLAQTLNELVDVLLQTRDWLQQQSRHEAVATIDDPVLVRETLSETALELNGLQPTKSLSGAGGNGTELATLVRAVESIRTRLDDVVMNAHGNIGLIGHDSSTESSASEELSGGPKPKIDLNDIGISNNQPLNSEDVNVQSKPLETFDATTSLAGDSVLVEDAREVAEVDEVEEGVERAPVHPASSFVIFGSGSELTTHTVWWRRLLWPFRRQS